MTAEPPRPVTNSSLENELARLQSASIVTLRSQWAELFDGKPPKAFGPDLLRRSIAQKLQERTCGALSKSTSRLLEKLVAEHGERSHSTAQVPRQIKPGAILHREWNGIGHSVTVFGEQFLYQGKAFSNLSEIARLITGTRWSGPRFFRLDASRLNKPARDDDRRAIPAVTRHSIPRSRNTAVTPAEPI